VEVWDDPIKMQHFVALLARQGGKKEKRTDNEWILETGATTHMTHCRKFFVKFRPRGRHVTACKGGMTEIEGVGNIMVQGSFWNTPAPLLIRNVLYATGLTNNLLSGVMLKEAGLEGKLHESGLDLHDQTSGELRLRTGFLRGMPRVVLRPVSPAAQAPLNYGNPHSQGHRLTSQLDANVAWEPRHCTGTGGGVMDPTATGLLTGQLDANAAVGLHPCTVPCGGTPGNRDPPGCQGVCVCLRAPQLLR